MHHRALVAFIVNVAVATALIAGAAPRSARANGAFPDSYQIILPRDLPKRIVFSTNFGMVISDDDGVSWSWTCEQLDSQNAFLYMGGAPPNNNMYAISTFGLAYSADGSCSWTLSRGRLDNAATIDAFPHPTDPNRILAIAQERTMGNEILPYGIFPSVDGGRTFGAPIYSAPVLGGLLGVEIARSDPRIITLAMYENPGIRPRLVRTFDDGKTWERPIDLEPQLGANWFSIVEVDRANPKRIFFRVQEATGGDTLAMTEDGGVTVRKPVAFADRMTAFVQLASGTILVAGVSAGAPAGFRSIDGGKTFTAWENVPGVRALGERAGKLFILGDNFKDNFAMGVSTDEGMTVEPLTTYGKISAIHACAQTSCEMHCETIAERFMLWSTQMCRGAAGVGKTDAAVSSDGPPGPPGGGGGKGSGCSWGAAGANLNGGIAALLGALAGVLLRYRRQRHRRRAGRDAS